MWRGAKDHRRTDYDFGCRYVRALALLCRGSAQVGDPLVPEMSGRFVFRPLTLLRTRPHQVRCRLEFHRLYDGCCRRTAAMTSLIDTRELARSGRGNAGDCRRALRRGGQTQDDRDGVVLRQFGEMLRRAVASLALSSSK